MCTVHISAKVDYAVRAAIELAAHDADEGLVTAERIADAQQIPRPFLTSILQELRRANLIESKRGVDGGHKLARPASEIRIADVIRAVDGPMAAVAGVAPEQVDFHGTAAPLRDVWVAVRSSLRSVLEVITLADIVEGTLPPIVGELIARPGAWDRR